MQTRQILKILALVAIANGMPILAKNIFGPRLALPLDSGRDFGDGRPLFGRSKTRRGILVSILATTACAPLIGLDLTVGALAAIAAMAGDLFSSFAKRRLNFPPSSREVSDMAASKFLGPNSISASNCSSTRRSRSQAVSL